MVPARRAIGRQKGRCCSVSALPSRNRSNVIGMGILPLEYAAGENRESLGLSGEETFAIEGIAAKLEPRMTVNVTATAAGGKAKSFKAVLRIDTPDEAEYYRHGGILQYVLRHIAAK